MSKAIVTQPNFGQEFVADSGRGKIWQTGRRIEREFWPARQCGDMFVTVHDILEIIPRTFGYIS